MTETGIFLAILSAFFWSTNDIFNKKSILKGYDENFILWIRFPLCTLFTLPLGFLLWDPSKELLISTLFWLPLEIAGSIFFIKALKFSPLSEAVPFLSFIPIFSALGGFFLLDETIDSKGISGILLIISGSFIITGGSLKTLISPDRGIFYMILSAFCYGINVAIGKYAIVHSNPFFFTWYYCVVMSLGLLPFVRKKELVKVSNYKSKYIVPIGILFSLGGLSYNLALTFAPSSYVASAERISMIFGVIYGKIFFKEKIKRAFPATILMVIGVFLLTL